MINTTIAVMSVDQKSWGGIADMLEYEKARSSEVFDETNSVVKKNKGMKIHQNRLEMGSDWLCTPSIEAENIIWTKLKFTIDLFVDS
jgi:hypothetical protein